MPLYEYSCHRCGKKFEVIQKFADKPLTVHEECGGEVERLISVSALQFKGTGWYVTDYAGNGKSSASKSEHKDSKSEGSKSEGSKSEGSKSDSKNSESKSDSKPAPATTPST